MRAGEDGFRGQACGVQLAPSEMTIVCGTDFSTGANRAVLTAVQLAVAGKRPLHLVHAVPAYDAEAAHLGRDLGALAQGMLERIAERSRTLGATVEIHVTPGPPDEALIAIARDVDASLIVVGALGMRTPGAFGLGAHADRLAQRARTPVLVVRDAAPITSWLTENKPLRIALAVDFTQSSAHAARALDLLRAGGPTQLVALHVFDPAEQRRRLGLPAASTPSDRDPLLTTAVERDVAHHFASLAASMRIRVEPRGDSVAERLVELSKAELSDLLVLGTHTRGGLERLWRRSVSHDVLHGTDASVLCVPAPSEGPSLRAPAAHRVIGATDFSSAGDDAVARAYSVVEDGGTVLLLHVTPMTPDPDIATKLEALAPGDAAARGIRTETRVIVSSDPAREICEIAERLDADLVCVGKHGRSKVADVLLGSVAKDVIARTTKPVLICRGAAA